MLKIARPFIYLLWTIFCYFGFRWTLYYYWTFDVLDSNSWNELSNIWEMGMVFPWAFIFMFIMIIPLWIFGIWVIKKIDIALIIGKIITSPLKMNKQKRMQKMATKSFKVKKKKSYIDTRPAPLKPVVGEAFTTNPRKHIEQTDSIYSPQSQENDDDFYASREDRRELAMGEYDERERLPILGEPEDDDMNFSGSQKQFDNRGETYSSSAAPVDIKEIIETAGYKVLTNVKVGSDTIDYVAVSDSAVALCFEEQQQGDWLADEEIFSDSEPRWFSESAQKTSPAYRALQIRNKVNDAITETYPEMMVVPILVISKGNIVNASDMLDTWEDMKVFVSRIGAGGPSDLKKLNNLLPQNPDDSVNDEIVSQIEKDIKSIK